MNPVVNVEYAPTGQRLGIDGQWTSDGSRAQCFTLEEARRATATLSCEPGAFRIVVAHPDVARAAFLRARKFRSDSLVASATAAS